MILCLGTIFQYLNEEIPILADIIWISADLTIFSADLLISSANFFKLDQNSLYMFGTIAEYILTFGRVPDSRELFPGLP